MLSLYNSQLNHFGKRAYKEMNIPHPSAKATEKRIKGSSLTLEQARNKFKTTISTLTKEEIIANNKKFNMSQLIRKGIQ